ncbi:MAG: hypothetical protein QXT87_02735 [Thermoproteota archaeon]
MHKTINDKEEFQERFELINEQLEKASPHSKKQLEILSKENI